MEKPAETRYPIHDLLRRRWSPRAFSEQPNRHAFHDVGQAVANLIVQATALVG